MRTLILRRAHRAGIADVAWVVRALHVFAAAVVVGGAALAMMGAGRASARAFEWLFWGALVVLVLTGVGNPGGVRREAATGRLVVG